MPTQQTICVVGLWHLGLVNAVGFAEKGAQVLGLEFDAGKVRDLQGGTPPLFEPGLEELLRGHVHAGNLQFSSDPRVCRAADAVVIAYDSPVNERDEVDVTPVEHAAAALAPYLRSDAPVVITSQVPLGTSERIETTIRAARSHWASGVVYTPENLKLGAAIARFLQPDMLVFGASGAQAKRAVSLLYRPFRTKKLWTDLRTAEMVKHALNAYLATSISFINDIASLADALGADAVTVGQALKLDARIGQRALLTPGIGYSGGTLARDVQHLQAVADGLGRAVPLLRAVPVVNAATFDTVVSTLRQVLGSLARKKIGLLGLTYKPGTSTLRRSPALMLLRRLAAAQVECSAYDPLAVQDEAGEDAHLFTRAATVAELAEGADALVLVTEWPEFRELPYRDLAALMRQPVMFDTKNALDPAVLTAAGFRYLGFGRHGPHDSHDQHRHHRRRIASRAAASRAS